MHQDHQVTQRQNATSQFFVRLLHKPLLVFHQNGLSTVSTRLIAPGSRLVWFGPTVGYSMACLAAPGKFEVKRLGALSYRNDDMAVPSGDYFTSNFAGSAGIVGGYAEIPSLPSPPPPPPQLSQTGHPEALAPRNR